MNPLKLSLPLAAALSLIGCGSSGTTAPTSENTAVVSVSSSSPDGIYSNGNGLDLTVKFNHSVVVKGSPQLLLDTRAQAADSADAALSTAPLAIYKGGSGTDTLIFHYDVQAADRSPRLEYASASALDLNGGSIRDGNGLAASLALPAPGAAGALSANTNIHVINWGSAAKVSDADAYPSTAKKTYTDSQGNSATLWYQKVSDSDKKLWAQFHDQSSNTDSTPAIIAQMSSTDNFDASKAIMTSQGNAVLLWSIRSTTSGYQTLYTCTLGKSGACGAVLSVGNLPGTLLESETAFASTERDHQIVLLWKGSGQQARTYNTVSQSWTAALTLSSTSDSMFDSSYIEDAQGNLAVIWPRDGDYHIHVLRRNVSTGLWSNVELSGYGQYPKIAADSSGNLAAVWEDRTSDPTLGGMGQIASSVFNSTTATWGAKQYISSAPVATWGIAKQLIHTGNTAMVAWTENRHVLTSYLDWSTPSWSAPLQVSGTTPVDSVSGLLASNGDINMIWSRHDQLNSPPTIFYGLYYNKTRGQWSSPTTIVSDGASSVGLPVLQNLNDSSISGNWTQPSADLSHLENWAVLLK